MIMSCKHQFVSFIKLNIEPFKLTEPINHSTGVPTHSAPLLAAKYVNCPYLITASGLCNSDNVLGPNHVLFAENQSI